MRNGRRAWHAACSGRQGSSSKRSSFGAHADPGHKPWPCLRCSITKGRDLEPSCTHASKLTNSRLLLARTPPAVCCAAEVGIIGIHWKGEFIELVPWNAGMEWEVEPWGSWKVSAAPVLRI